MSALLAACRPCNATDADPRLAHLPFEGDAACCFRVFRAALRQQLLSLSAALEKMAAAEMAVPAATRESPARA